MLRRLLLLTSLALPACALAAAPVLAPVAAPVPRAAPSQAAPTARAIAVITPRVLARYPHARDAFTQGLELHGGALLESTGLIGQSSLRRVRWQTGEVTRRTAPPSNRVFAEGLSVFNNVAYQLTWRDGLAYLYDPLTLGALGQVRYQGEGWGLTHDDKALILSNGSDTLTWRDPKSFAVTRSLRVTALGAGVLNLNELEYAAGLIYANVWLTNRIARIDPQSGAVTAWIDVSALTREAQLAAERSGQPLGFDDVPNGIAYDAGRKVWLLTGKRWPLLFEVSLP